ncbi:hypothetical protein Tco_0906216 [Tanacetum coccineum]
MYCPSTIKKLSDKSSCLSFSEIESRNSSINRRGRSRVNGLNIQGEWTTEPLAIKNHIFSSFHACFVGGNHSRPLYSSNLFKQLAVEDSHILDCPFTIEEIKEAVWNCGSSKALDFKALGLIASKERVCGSTMAPKREKALVIEGDVYPEWCLEFFSTMYFERGVDRTKLMTEKCVWFRLCRQKHVLTLPEFAVLLELYEPSELDHRLFVIHFSKLEVDDKLFDHNEYWKKIGKTTKTNKRTSLIREPLMRIVHGIIIGAFVHRLSTEYLCKSASRIKENSSICGGHYVTKIAQSLGYYVDEETKKCSEPIECEKWTTKMLAKELNLDNQTLLQSTLLPQPPRVTREQRQEPSGLNSSWGDWNASLNEIKRRNAIQMIVFDDC